MDFLVFVLFINFVNCSRNIRYTVTASCNWPEDVIAKSLYFIFS